MLDNVWAQIAPFVYGLVGVFGAGLPVGAILYFVLRKLLTKWLGKIADKLLSGASPDSVADSVAKKIASSVVGVDLTAITEKQFAAMETAVTERVKAIEQKEEDVRQGLALVLNALMPSEIVTEETKAEMRGYIEKAGQAATEAKKVIELKIEPVVLEEVVTVEHEKPKVERA